MEVFLKLGLTSYLVATVIAFIVYYWYNCIHNHYWKLRNVPSSNPWYSSGFLISLLKGKPIFELDNVQYKKHGRICGVYFERSPMLLLSEPELLRLVFVKDFHAFTDRRTALKDNVMGKMLSTLEGDDWKRMRTIVSPVFSSGKMRRLAKLINVSAGALTSSLVTSAEKENNVQLKSLFGTFAMDVIASTAFGTEVNSIENPDNPFVNYAKKIFTFRFNWRILFLVFAPKLFMKLKIRLLNPEAIDFFASIVLKIKEQRIKEGKTYDDFLQMLMDAELEEGEKEEAKDDIHFRSAVSASLKPHKNVRKTLSTDELVSQCVLFFLGGYDTTSTTLAFVAYNLALNPHCQDVLLKEVDETWQKHGKMDFDIVNSMRYLDAVVAETLRMYPVTSRLERKCLQDYELGDTGLTIPSGMYVGVPVYSIHHDPEFYPDPETFDPERFLPENKDNIKPYTYLPFGSGPRNCVGMRFALMEVKLCLAHVLQRVTFHRCTETQVPPVFLPASLLIQMKEITLQVQKRSH